MASDAFAADDMRLTGIWVEVDGLVAAITAGDIATSASDAKVSVNGGEDLGLAVEVGGAYERGQLFAYEVFELFDAPFLQVGL